MATCFVYIRKSTNTREKQANSLGFQKYWVKKLLDSRPDLDVIGLDGRVCEVPQDWYIVESVSAKEESVSRRSGFQHMLRAIEDFWVDYVISCYASRISRNDQDTTAFMNITKETNQKIRLGVITQERTYETSSQSDMMFLNAALFAAKQDNTLRSIGAKDYHQYKKEEDGIFTSRMPFGYDPLYKEWSVLLNTEKAQLVRLAYELRLNGCQWTEIAEKFKEKGYKKTGGSIKAMLLSPIYYGEFKFNGLMYPIKNKWWEPLIDKPTYDKLVEYEKVNGRKHWKANPVSSKNSQKLLDKMVYDVAGQMLQWGITKEKAYFHQRNKNYTYKINVAESKLFREAWKQIEKFSPPPAFAILIEAQLREKLADVIKEQDRRVNVFEWEIKGLKDNISGWLDKLWTTTQSSLIEAYEWKIVETTEKIKKMEQELIGLKANKKDIGSTAKMYSNLFKDLSGTYKKVSKSEKADILRWLGVSFIVWPDSHITLVGWRFERLFIPNQKPNE